MSIEIIRAETQPGRPVDRLAVGIAQIAPVWLDRAATLARVCAVAEQASSHGVQLLTFGEALVPGYPFWVERTDGARFDDPRQKAIYAHYLDQGVVLERGDLSPVQAIARRSGMATYLGVMERAPDRGGHSLYCSLVYIGPDGAIGSVHRKLQPTYEERLVWAAGDGHGLRVHRLGAFTVGGLNCYENWMPLARAALSGQGEDLHVAVWPGGLHNTQDITRFIAREGRSFVISASALLRRSDIEPLTPALAEMAETAPEWLANGGSAIAGPEGEFLVPPVVGREALILADIDHARVREERQTFDPAGHYSRPDVTHLVVDRRRQGWVECIDGPGATAGTDP